MGEFGRQEFGAGGLLRRTLAGLCACGNINTPNTAPLHFTRFAGQG